MFRSNTIYLPYIQFFTTMVMILTLLFNFDLYWLMASLLMYCLVGCFGISIGFHRYLTHRSFELRYNWFKWPLLFLGCLAGTGSPIGWVAVHKEHHRRSDRVGDPHSPHLLGNKSLVAKYSYRWDKWPIRNLIVNPIHRIIHDQYFLLLLAWIILACLIDINIALYMVIIPMALSIWASTISNYLNHYYGYRTYRTNDESKNLWVTAYLTFGEGWHNNHHAHANEYRFGKKYWEWDLGAWFIEHGLKRK